MFRFVLMVVCIACFCGSSVRAQDASTQARQTVHDDGLEGTWSVACKEPPTVARRIRWIVPKAGPVQQWVDEGAGFVLKGLVSSFIINPSGSTTISVQALTGWTWVGTDIHVGAKIREIDVTDFWKGTPHPYIRSGRFIRGPLSGIDTFLIEKCDEPGELVS